jgi:hypothetical protein
MSKEERRDVVAGSDNAEVPLACRCTLRGSGTDNAEVPLARQA